MARFSPSLDGLVDLACRDGVDIRPTLLRVLTDLYVQKRVHTAEEETQYVELALGLIDTVDDATRAAVAAALSAYPAAPTAILGKLAAWAPAGHQASAPAGAEPASAAELAELFFSASAGDRGMILANLDIAAGPAVQRAAAASGEMIRRLESAALRRNSGEFSRMLARALDVDAAMARKIAQDYSGEPIVVAARVLGMTAAVLQRILLFLNPVVGQSVDRVFALARLYDALSPEAASHMVAIWRQAGEKSQVQQSRHGAQHAPLHWHDEPRDARSLASPAQHRTEPRRDATPDRIRPGAKA